MRIYKCILLVSFLVFSIFSYAVSQEERSIATQQQRVNNKGTLTTHVVKAGDTVYSIANAYGVEVGEIYSQNPGTTKGINIGQSLIIPQKETQAVVKTFIFKHKIKSKETLFSVSQAYNITVAELLQANPGLDESTFTIGREIVIPDVYAQNQKSKINEQESVEIAPTTIEHKVAKQETLYSISKQYQCSIADIFDLNPTVKEMGLREGMSINIPVKEDSTEVNSALAVYGNAELLNFVNPSAYYVPKDGVVRVALLLPFINGAKTVSQEKITEYYEGFLLAVQRMKERGLNAEIYTFDIGTDDDTKRLENILGASELNNLNLIIGGVSPKQVQLISAFCKKTGIKYVVPFTNKNTGIELNPNLFQVANSHNNLYGKIAKGFANKFNGSNVVFLTESGSNENKMDFVKALQKELDAAGITYRNTPTTPSITDDLMAVVDGNKNNIIIPTSSSEATLTRILSVLELLKQKNISFSLFGYPEWQTYVNSKSKLQEYNSYFYSMFYLDRSDPSAQLFADKYKQWYNKSLVVSYPKFAHMGYDTGIVFLTALQKLGHDFGSRLNSLNTQTIQSALYFQPVSEAGGYVNTGVYFINLKPDGSAEKTLIK